MRKTTIVNKLLDIQHEINKPTWDNNITEIRKDITSLLEELQHDVYFEDKGFSTNEKKATEKALSVLKSLEKTHAPFATTKIEEGYQTFAEGHWAIALKNVNELLPISEDRKVNVFPFFKDFTLDGTVKLKLDFEDLFKKLKAKSLKSSVGKVYSTDKNFNKVYYGEMTNNEDRICFNAEFMKTIVTIMGSKIENLKVYGRKSMDNSYYHILIVDTENGNLGYLLPIKTTNSY